MDPTFLLNFTAEISHLNMAISRLSSNTFVNIMYAAKRINASHDSSGHRSMSVFSQTVLLLEQEATSPAKRALDIGLLGDVLRTATQQHTFVTNRGKDYRAHMFGICLVSCLHEYRD